MADRGFIPRTQRYPTELVLVSNRPPLSAVRVPLVHPRNELPYSRLASKLHKFLEIPLHWFQMMTFSTHRRQLR